MSAPAAVLVIVARPYRRCPYCGVKCRGAWTCAGCADLPALDPAYCYDLAALTQ